MAKIDMDILKRVLIDKTDLSNPKIIEVFEELERQIAAEKAEKEAKAESLEKKFVVVRFSAAEALEISAQKTIESSVEALNSLNHCWVLQMAKDDAEGVLKAKIKSAIEMFNNSKKGRRYPVKKLSEAFEFIPAKIWKEFNLTIKTKEPTIEISVD